MDQIESISLLKETFEFVSEEKYLKMFKYSKEFQKKLNLTKEDYDGYAPIVLEIIPVEDINEKEGITKFINQFIDKSLCYIYFNDSKEKIDRNFLKTGEKISKIIVRIKRKVKSLKDLFFNCKAIKEIKFTKFITNNISDMSGMFSWCNNLIKLDISKIKTDNVVDMNNMFRNCLQLKEIDLTNFKTDKVKNMDCMFYLCDSLETLNFKNFNTNNVESMNNMFYYCGKLKELNLSSFQTDKVTSMNSMFYGCESLEDLNISSFRVNQSCSMKDMFRKCISLTYLDLSQFNIPQDNKLISGIFKNCSNELKNNIRNQKPYLDFS